MELGAFKPLLTSLLMPPLAPLLLALLGALLVFRKKRGGRSLVALSVVMLWLLSCDGMAVWLARHALPQFAAISTPQLQTRRVQAIVVLGGGLLPDAPEYGGIAQPSATTAARLRYGVWLARQSGMPLAFSGGAGWGTDGMKPASEADVAARVALQDYGFTLRWAEGASRDTSSNARLLAPILQRDGVQRIALVTHAGHMPRALAAFERAGITVTPAPMGFVLPAEHGFRQWLPSARGLLTNQQVLHECLGLVVGQFIPI